MWNGTVHSWLIFNISLGFVLPSEDLFDLLVDGLGGLLLSAAHFRGLCIGTEINYQVGLARGKSSRQGEGDLRDGYHSIQANFEQYNLENQLLSIILGDASKQSLWKYDEIFDVIISDPPYGLREKSRKLGTKKTEV